MIDVANNTNDTGLIAARSAFRQNSGDSILYTKHLHVTKAAACFGTVTFECNATLHSDLKYQTKDHHKYCKTKRVRQHDKR